MRWLASALVFGSGLCALVYQVVWTRELRLVFGASTAASSAVVAIFVAGLGFGGLFFGARAERSQNPMRMYARLELAIALLSALTPLTIHLVRDLYVWSGGTPRLGSAGGNALRLVLAGVVLSPPTFLMGGTLPAVASAIERDADRSRRAVAVAYATNTLGAVLGALLTTFVMLEAWGNRATLLSACALNVLVAGGAALSGRPRAALQPELAAPPEPESEAVVGSYFAYASAFVSGFAFFLMELVWYRVLAPMLGGSVFTFGLILSVALAGIGFGSALYATFGAARRSMLLGFAITCAAEAVCMIAPYAFGDRLALGALFLQSFAALGFGGVVSGWFVIATLAIFPAALVAGFQFPLLIALLGSGQRHVGRDVGNTYLANTLGALVGSLAGGFGALPALGALGCWRAVSMLLAAWSALTVVVALSRRTKLALAPTLAVLLLCGASARLVSAEGPTAVLRHSPIGVGRVPLSQFTDPNSVAQFVLQERRSVDWQTDGIESAVAITHYDGVSFVVNGKSDGSAVIDAATQVMSGLLGAALLPRVHKALVIGLGTGSTAGWLASVPEIERVDVAEIEPAILQVAKRCRAVNRDVLHNPKVHILRGDARELLSVLRDDYDVIFSEPSNPYRAGVSSLYAREFYELAQRRLTPSGLFVQWLQAYDVDAASVQTIYATLDSVFEHVETWNGLREDLLLVASRQPLVHDVAALRARIAQEPFPTAMRHAWYTEGVEGFLSHFVANDAFTRAAADGAPELNTDDHSPVEFDFARSARGGTRYSVGSLFAAVHARGMYRPDVKNGPVDWDRVDFERETFALVMGSAIAQATLPPAYQTRFAVLSKWTQNDYVGALNGWNINGLSYPHLEPTPIERLAFAELIAREGSIESERTLVTLLPDRPTEAAALHAMYLMRQGRRKAGQELVIEALRRYRSDPWPYMLPMVRFLSSLQITEDADRERAVRWLEELAPPFALRVNESARDRTRLRLAIALGASHPGCVQVFESFEPYPPWNDTTLEFRFACYDAHHNPLRDQAQRDLESYRKYAATDFESLLELRN